MTMMNDRLWGHPLKGLSRKPEGSGNQRDRVYTLDKKRDEAKITAGKALQVQHKQFEENL